LVGISGGNHYRSCGVGHPTADSWWFGNRSESLSAYRRAQGRMPPDKWAYSTLGRWPPPVPRHRTPRRRSLPGRVLALPGRPVDSGWPCRRRSSATAWLGAVDRFRCRRGEPTLTSRSHHAAWAVTVAPDGGPVVSSPAAMNPNVIRNALGPLVRVAHASYWPRFVAFGWSGDSG